MNKTYVMSDIHGCFFTFIKMLKKIKFDDTDTLYIVGDVIDRGANPIELIKYIMSKKNIILISGNHEHMMLDAMKILNNPKDETINDENKVLITYDWYSNGGTITRNLLKLEAIETQEKILEYVKNLEEYKLIEVDNKKYLLIHAGLFIPENKKVPEEIDFQKLLDINVQKELNLYIREDFLDANEYITNTTIIFGHTPVNYIPKYTGYKIKPMTKTNLKRCEEYKIYKTKYKIGIDCGCGSKNGQLGCLCLNDMKEYYVKKNDKDFI